MSRGKVKRSVFTLTEYSFLSVIGFLKAFPNAHALLISVKSVLSKLASILLK